MGKLCAEVRILNSYEFPYLSLTDLLDQNLSAYEFFQTLSPEMQRNFRRCQSEIATFEELHARAARLRAEGIAEW